MIDSTGLLCTDISQALAADEHFKQAGLIPLLLQI